MHSINSDLYIKQDQYNITTDDVQIRGVERRFAESDTLSFLTDVCCLPRPVCAEKKKAQTLSLKTLSVEKQR